MATGSTCCGGNVTCLLPLPHDPVVRQHLLDRCAGRRRFEFVGRSGQELLAVGADWRTPYSNQTSFPAKLTVPCGAERGDLHEWARHLRPPARSEQAELALVGDGQHPDDDPRIRRDEVELLGRAKEEMDVGL